MVFVRFVPNLRRGAILPRKVCAAKLVQTESRIKQTCLFFMPRRSLTSQSFVCKVTNKRPNGKIKSGVLWLVRRHFFLFLHLHCLLLPNQFHTRRGTKRGTVDLYRRMRTVLTASGRKFSRVDFGRVAAPHRMECKAMRAGKLAPTCDGLRLNLGQWLRRAARQKCGYCFNRKWPQVFASGFRPSCRSA